jgi:glutathione S-transferase
MPLTLHYLSGSPYAWRVWLALAHKDLDVTLRPMSFDAGDFKADAFGRLNPRRRVPVLDDDGFVLYESAAIVEYIEDRWPDRQRLFSPDIHQRALQRRMIREADQYFATDLEHLVDAVLFTAAAERDPTRIATAWNALCSELARWEPILIGDFLAGPVSAADYALYPEIQLALRIVRRNPGIAPGIDADALLGPRMQTWEARMTALPVVQATWPPHWKG